MQSFDAAVTLLVIVSSAPASEEHASSRLPWIAAFAGLVFGGVLAWIARRRRAK